MNHLPLDQLADVDAVADDEHLRTCAHCRQLWEQQRDVRDVLRSLPDPGVLPPDVATALSDRLSRLTSDDVAVDDVAVEGTRRSLEHVDEGSAAGATVVPLRRPEGREPGRRARALLAVAAAVVVLGGGGAAVVSRPWSGADSASTASGGAAQREVATDSASKAAREHVVSSGTNYRRATLDDQVRALLAASTAGPPASSPTSSAGGGEAPSLAGGDDSGPLSTPAGLASCLSALGVDAGQVTAVDLAEFEGEPAAVIVLRGTDGGQDVWVVGRQCRQGADDTRYFTRLP